MDCNSLLVGDVVKIYRRLNKELWFGEVKRLTKTQVILAFLCNPNSDAFRYRKNNGNEIGASSWYLSSSIERIASQEEKEQFLQQLDQAKARQAEADRKNGVLEELKNRMPANTSILFDDFSKETFMVKGLTTKQVRALFQETRSENEQGA